MNTFGFQSYLYPSFDLPLTGAFGNTTSSENSKKYEQIPMEKSNSFIYKRDYKKIPPEILDKINKKFEENKYPTQKDMETIASEYNYPYQKIDNWFKHKRSIEANKGMMTIKRRRQFTKFQKEFLKNYFRTSPVYPNKNEMQRIADEIKVDIIQVRAWFSYKRRLQIQKQQESKQQSADQHSSQFDNSFDQQNFINDDESSSSNSVKIEAHINQNNQICSNSNQKISQNLQQQNALNNNNIITPNSSQMVNNTSQNSISHKNSYSTLEQQLKLQQQLQILKLNQYHQYQWQCLRLLQQQQKEIQKQQHLQNKQHKHQKQQQLSKIQKQELQNEEKSDIENELENFKNKQIHDKLAEEILQLQGSHIGLNLAQFNPSLNAANPLNAFNTHTAAFNSIFNPNATASLQSQQQATAAAALTPFFIPAPSTQGSANAAAQFFSPTSLFNYYPSQHSNAITQQNVQHQQNNVQNESLKAFLNLHSLQQIPFQQQQQQQQTIKQQTQNANNSNNQIEKRLQQQAMQQSIEQLQQQQQINQVSKQEVNIIVDMKQNMVKEEHPDNAQQLQKSFSSNQIQQNQNQNQNQKESHNDYSNENQNESSIENQNQNQNQNQNTSTINNAINNNINNSN